MNEHVDQPSLAASGPQAMELRAELERMRKEAQQEIARLNRKLSEREYALAPDAASATERQALQQELLTLRNALRHKERTLDDITAECRRLEDALEDQHLAFDGLKQEVQRKDSSLQAAREEVDRLRRQLATVREQPSSVELRRDPYPPLPQTQMSSLAVDEPESGRSRRVFTFSAGLIAGLALIGLVILLVWNNGRTGRSGGPTAPAPQPLPEQTQTQTPPPADSSPEAPAAPLESPVPPVEVAPEEPSRLPVAAPPPVVRDRLRDGGLGPTLAVLPGGTFRMGLNTLAGGDTGPEHEVRIAPFLIGVYEVTFSQYDRFASATGRPPPNDYGFGRGDHPVVGISWADALAYADWLTRQTGKRYRLPTEAEWEYAARAGSRGSYWWGFGMEPGRAACFDCGTEWDNRSTAPVGSFLPSPYGLYDTAGNAMEWVLDCYTAGYDGAPSNGAARTDGDCGYRLARGGAFNKPSSSMRVYARSKLPPEARLDMLGFRVVREP